MNLVIDVGNSRVKFGIFENSKLLHKVNFTKKEFQKKLKKVCKDFNLTRAVISSTGKLEKEDVKLLQKELSFIEVTSQLKYPFKNKYKTPKTLGADRIAVMTAAALSFPNTNTLVIDVGTCVTFDFLDSNAVYKGGAISILDRRLP